MSADVLEITRRIAQESPIAAIMAGLHLDPNISIAQLKSCVPPTEQSKEFLLEVIGTSPWGRDRDLVPDIKKLSEGERILTTKIWLMQGREEALPLWQEAITAIPTPSLSDFINYCVKWQPLLDYHFLLPLLPLPPTAMEAKELAQKAIQEEGGKMIKQTVDAYQKELNLQPHLSLLLTFSSLIESIIEAQTLGSSFIPLISIDYLISFRITTAQIVLWLLQATFQAPPEEIFNTEPEIAAKICSFLLPRAISLGEWEWAFISLQGLKSNISPRIDLLKLETALTIETWGRGIQQLLPATFPIEEFASEFEQLWSRISPDIPDGHRIFLMALTSKILVSPLIRPPVFRILNSLNRALAKSFAT